MTTQSPSLLSVVDGCTKAGGRSSSSTWTLTRAAAATAPTKRRRPTLAIASAGGLTKDANLKDQHEEELGWTTDPFTTRAFSFFEIT
jgi:hypothetical protein